ncbi:MAG TPA: DUF4340 domain-containing protein [Polyangiaceae bacterium]
MATTDTKLYAALGILAVLGGALFVTTKKEKEEAEHYSLSGRAAELPKVEISEDDANKVTKITLTKPGKDGAAPSEVVLVKKGEEWRLEKPVDALANQANVKSLLDNLKTLKVSESIDPGKDAYDKYEVSDSKGLHAVFSKDNGVVLDAWFGQSGGRGQMTRLAGKDGVYAMKGYSSYLYDREAKNWREMSLFKFEEGDVTAVNLDNEQGSFVFAKTGEEWSGKFKKAKGGALAPIAKFDSSKVLDLIRPYKGLTADDFADKSKTAADLGLDKPVAQLSFTLKDGGKRDVKLGGNSTGSSRWIQVSGKDEFFSTSSWAADWATADEKKFQKADEKKADAAAAPAPHGLPPTMPAGMDMGHEDPH